MSSGPEEPGSVHCLYDLCVGKGLGHNLCLGNAGCMEREASPQTSPMPIPATPLANPAPKTPLLLLTWSHSWSQSHSQQHVLSQIQGMTAFQGQMQGTRHSPASWLTDQEDGDRLRDPVRGAQHLVTRAPLTRLLAQTPVLSCPWVPGACRAHRAP